MAGRVAVLYTGGTIGTRRSQAELQPDEDAMLSPHELRLALPQPKQLGVEFEFVPLQVGGGPWVPVVSSRIGPADWKVIAESIAREYDNYDGFVVLHGTDTMAYTASVLSFMFVNLGKPVVLTGSQRPMSDVPSDAHSNFINSVLLAARARDTIPLIPEVVICFGDLVLRGNRAQKLSSTSWRGFDTPNAAHLGRVGRTFEIATSRLRPMPAPGAQFFLRADLESAVVDIMMFPGMSALQLASALSSCVGAVLRTFGAGNPPGDAGVLEVIRQAASAGKVLVNITQCNEGTVEAGMLTGSRSLTDCGVISGLDMTAEAAFTKLSVLLGNQPSHVAAVEMQLDQRGEQSIDMIEMRTTQTRQSGPARVVLSDTVMARYEPGRLISAVLRLADIEVPESSSGHVATFINHWFADRTVGDDPRLVSSGTPAGPHRLIVTDVTDKVKQLVEQGGPVTITVVPSAREIAFRASLTLFIDRTGRALVD